MSWTQNDVVLFYHLWLFSHGKQLHHTILPFQFKSYFVIHACIVTPTSSRRFNIKGLCMYVYVCNVLYGIVLFGLKCTWTKLFVLFVYSFMYVYVMCTYKLHVPGIFCTEANIIQFISKTWVVTTFEFMCK